MPVGKSRARWVSAICLVWEARLRSSCPVFTVMPFQVIDALLASRRSAAGKSTTLEPLRGRIVMPLSLIACSET